MYEGANYFTIPSFAELGFLLLMSIYIMRYLLNDTSVYILHKLLPILCKHACLFWQSSLLKPSTMSNLVQLFSGRKRSSGVCQKLPEPVHVRVTTSTSGYCC